MAGWLNKPKNINNYIGFVYVIENLENGMKYIGSKQFWFKRKKKTKGKKRKEIYHVESDWKNYYGSSEYLTSEIKKFGRRKFKRTILKCYKTKWEILYYEAKEQFKYDVLLDSNYYNYWIRIKLRKKK